MSVIENGSAQIAGLRQGDVLKSVNGKTLKTPGDFYKAISEERGEIKLSFHRQGVDLSIGIIR